MKPKFLEGKKLDAQYYKKPDPYKKAPSCHVNLLEISRYANRTGKKLAELTQEEIRQFHI